MTTAAAPTLDLVVDQLLFIDPNQLESNPLNPRKDLGDLEEMAATIRDGGVREPLLVTPAGIVVAGHRRLAAALLAEAAEVPVIARNLHKAQQLETMLVENLQRTDITPLEEAQAYQQLLDLGALAGDIVAAVGVREERIRKRTALLQLPNRARELLQQGAMTMAAAEELLKLRDHPDVMERVVEEQLEHSGATSKDDPIHHFWWVERELNRIRVDAARAEAEETARAKGLKLVKLPGYNAKSKVIGRGYDELAINAKAHENQKCHAVAIDQVGKLRAVCTKPANHVSDEPKKVTPAPRGHTDWAAKQAAMQERRTQRREIIKTALAGNLKPVTELTTKLLLAGRGAPCMVEDSLLCAVLEIPFEPGVHPATEAFTTWLLEGDLQPIRVNRALAGIILLAVDADLEDNGVEGNAWPVYAMWLQEQGYTFPHDTDDSYEVDEQAIAEERDAIAKDPRRAFMDVAR